MQAREGERRKRRRKKRRRRKWMTESELWICAIQIECGCHRFSRDADRCA